jgi:hypothetical protein
LADSAYATGDALAELTQAGHTPIIKPWPLRPAVEGGFTLDDFPVTEPTGNQPGSVSCPNGHTRPLSATRTATFGALCRDCPLRARCTTSKTGRSMRIHPHDAVTRAHRQRARDPEFQATYRRHRPMVERSISWLVAGGNRRLRFRGTARNDQWLHHRVAGLNLRRLLTLGLERTAGGWTIAVPAWPHRPPQTLTETTTSATLAATGRVNSLSRSSGNADPHAAQTALRDPARHPRPDTALFQERPSRTGGRAVTRSRPVRTRHGAAPCHRR